MNPADIDAVDDELFAAMVRHMQAEADAIRTAHNKLPKR